MVLQDHHPILIWFHIYFKTIIWFDVLMDIKVTTDQKRRFPLVKVNSLACLIKQQSSTMSFYFERPPSHHFKNLKNNLRPCPPYNSKPSPPLQG